MPSTNKPRVVLNNRVPSKAVEDSTKEEEDLTGEVLFDRKPSPFIDGLSRQAALLTGCSDDSDLPRLSPIRTRSETDLNSWEKTKHKLNHHQQQQPQISEREDDEGLFPRFSLQTELDGYPSNTGRLFGGADISDFSLSPEDATTTTSGQGSALSEDVWQLVSSSEFPALNSELTTATDDQNTPTVASSSARPTSRTLSSLFDSLTTSINKGLHSLAVKAERVTSNAAREFSGSMRCVSDMKPDNSFFEVNHQQQPIGFTDKLLVESPNKVICRPIHQPDMASYDIAFNQKGGQDFYDELESICNEYAKKLNKQRKNLQKGKKSQLDCFMTKLYPIFDVVGSPSESEEGDTSESITEDDQFNHYYESIDLMVQESINIATQQERCSILEIANLVANPVNVLGSASSIPVTPLTSRCAELYVELEAAVQHGKHSLELIHEEGVLRMAELSTTCLKYLLDLASQLTSRLEPELSLKPQQIIWPDNGEEIAVLLRSFVIRLIHNLEAVTGAFLAALLGLGNSYDENLRDYSVGQKANALASDLELDSCSAVRKVQESLRNLMYVVVYTTFTS